MSKYDKILGDLMTSAGRKRDCLLCKARAEMDTVNREYTAYIDGAADAIKEIERLEHLEGGGNHAE